MFNNESDNESIFPQKENSIFSYSKDENSFHSMENENGNLNFSLDKEFNDESLKKLEQIQDISKDISTDITKPQKPKILGKKIKRYENDEEITDLKQISKFNSNQFDEKKKDEDMNKDIPFLIFFKEDKKNEEFLDTIQEEESIYIEKTSSTKKEKKFKVSDLISQNCCKNVRFDGIVKKVKKLFFHHILKKSNEILKKNGISKQFRIPSHDFTKNVTIESNKFILTIDIKSLFCSTYENKCHIGDVLKKKIEDNKSIFENYFFLEIEYYFFFCIPLEKLLSDYLNSPEFLEDVKTLNMKCKKNPIQLDRILGDGENNLINYFKLNQRYGKK